MLPVAIQISHAIGAEDAQAMRGRGEHLSFVSWSLRQPACRAQARIFSRLPPPTLVFKIVDH